MNKEYVVLLNTDEQALLELQYLLLDQAHNWWVRRKEHLTPWWEAIRVLENQYSRKPPANWIYAEILKYHYDYYEPKDDFIRDKTEIKPKE